VKETIPFQSLVHEQPLIDKAQTFGSQWKKTHGTPTPANALKFHYALARHLSPSLRQHMTWPEHFEFNKLMRKILFLSAVKIASAREGELSPYNVSLEHLRRLGKIELEIHKKGIDLGELDAESHSDFPLDKTEALALSRANKKSRKTQYVQQIVDESLERYLNTLQAQLFSKIGRVKHAGIIEAYNQAFQAASRAVQAQK